VIEPILKATIEKFGKTVHFKQFLSKKYPDYSTAYR
jgi:hypothetical protein